VARITTSAPTLSGTPPKLNPAFVEEPRRAKKKPGGPVTTAVAASPGFTVKGATVTAALWAKIGSGLSKQSDAMAKARFRNI
jgi:hypothetical protein